MSGASLVGVREPWCPSCASRPIMRDEWALSPGKACRLCGFSYPTAFTIPAVLASEIVYSLRSRGDSVLAEQLAAILRQATADRLN